MKQSECKTQKEYDELFYKRTTEIIQKLVDFVNNNQDATYRECVAFVGSKETFNEEYEDEDETTWQFDFHTDYFVQTLSKENGKIKLCLDFEIWDDDYVAGSGNFKVSESVIDNIDAFVKELLGQEYSAWEV